MAGSFMEGFGNAFASSFNAGMARNEERRNDTFKLMYSDYLERKKETATKKREVEQNIKFSKTLASDYGLPQEAWQKIYEWKDAGLDDKQIFSNIEQGVWGTAQKTDNAQAVDQAATVDPRQQVQVAQTTQPSPMDNQMSASGMAPAPKAAQAPTTVPTPQQAQQGGNPINNLPTMKKGLLGAASGIFGKNATAERDRERGFQRIGQITGQSREQIDQTLSGEGVPQVPQYGGTYKRAPSSGNGDIDSVSKINAEISEAQSILDRNPGDKNAQERLKRATNARDNWYAFKREEALAQEAGRGGMGYMLVDEKGELKGFSDQVDANGNAMGMDGKSYPAKQVPMEFRKQIFETAGKMQKGIDEYRAKARGLNGFMDATTAAYKTIADDPSVMAGSVNYANSSILDVVKNIDAGTKLLDGMLSGASADEKMSALQQINPNAIAAEMKNLEGLINSPTLDANNKLAAKSALFEAQKTLMVYQYGMAIEQSGRAMTDADFQRIEKIVVSGKDAKTFLANAAAAINPVFNGIRQSAKDIDGSNMEIKALKSGYGLSKIPQLEVGDYGEEVKENYPDIYKYLNENNLGRHSGGNVGKEVVDKHGGSDKPATPNDTQKAVRINQAKAAIAKGASREAVIEKLKSMGIEPGDI